MTPGIRVIRFARAESANRPGTGSVARVLLDEQPDSAGQIIQRAQLWEYVLPDGTPSGLTSTLARQDLERQVPALRRDAVFQALFLTCAAIVACEMSLETVD